MFDLNVAETHQVAKIPLETKGELVVTATVLRQLH